MLIEKICKICLQPFKVKIQMRILNMNPCLHVDRLKKKTIDQKKAMENDLKRTITKTVEEMDEKISNTKNQM